MNPSLVQKRSVAAAEIDQPGFADILQMNERVPARHFRRIQHDRVDGGSPERTTALDGMASAIGRFQPGTFFWGYAHLETFYRKVMVDAKCLIWRPSELARIRRGSASPALNFLSTLMMYTLSR